MGEVPSASNVHGGSVVCAGGKGDVVVKSIRYPDAGGRLEGVRCGYGGGVGYGSPALGVGNVAILVLRNFFLANDFE